MAEPRLSPRHLAAPRKLILLVRIALNGDYEAVTLSGEVALIGKSREEIKEKMRIQVRQMKPSVRPTTVRLHFVADQRTWLHAPLPEDEQPGTARSAASRDTAPTNAKNESEASRHNGETEDTSAKSRSRKS